MKSTIALFISILLAGITGYSQKPLLNADHGLMAEGFIVNGTRQYLDLPVQLLTLIINDSLISSEEAQCIEKDGIVFINFGNNILGEVHHKPEKNGSSNLFLKIINESDDTLILENLVPFGEDTGHVYITSTGPWALARAKLFRPGLGPVSVILPDNAWEMGYGAIKINDNHSMASIARRKQVTGGRKHRYKTYIYPGGSMEYNMYFHPFAGKWQEGLRTMFQDKLLYDLDAFDNTLFERPDLKWIRKQYLIGLQFAWDKDFYNWKTGEYTIKNFLEEGKELFGGYDIYGLWPTWPRLGLDPRNQWDMFHSLSGGTEKIKKISQEMQDDGTAFFICYNPWDESTREENPFKGMAKIIKATDANGVVLDCHGWSKEEYQHAADSIKKGVIMYSEGMAVIKDMPGIISGRVHNAIYLSPVLNLNKVIKPDFAIFRVLESKDENIHREAAISLFNGYGNEINYYAPERPQASRDDYLFLSLTIKILRENTTNFTHKGWRPLIPTLHDSIWVNHWPGTEKDVFTILSMRPEGFDGALFEIDLEEGFHLVSLWHHEELTPETINDKTFAPVFTEAFNPSWSNTRKEGAIDCIAILPDILKARIEGPKMVVSSDSGDEIRIWKGNPSYQKDFLSLAPGIHNLNILESFDEYQGKFVVQLFENDELLDERTCILKPGTPLLISQHKKSKITNTVPDGMVLVEGATFPFHTTNDDQFIPYPLPEDTVLMEVADFYMDTYPVTNKDYHEFIESTGYAPEDTSHYLRHWKDGIYPEPLAMHPVVYVSPEDAKAYALWAGKRLPTEAEWQYAAGGPEAWPWPWGLEYDSTLCNHASGKTSAVTAFPGGVSPAGILDMTGNVWQMTSDVYFNGSYYYQILKGGSFYKPTSSWWYIDGGAQPNHWQQMLLLVSPGLNRNATVGFRCVKDVR